jgi:repressor LexA
MEVLTPAQQELYDWLVQYININKHSPSIREMMKAMNLRSPAPIQSRLERIRNKGYIEWTEGQARTLRILRHETQGLPILGTITAGGLVEPFTDNQERLEFKEIFDQPNCYALQVVGDSMIEDHITEGDYVIMRSITAASEAKDGDIVAARVEGHGTTLKRVYFENKQIMLKASNPKYQPITAKSEQVQIQGILLAVCRLNNAHL